MVNNICRFTVREDGILIGVDTGMLEQGHVYEVKNGIIVDLGVSQIAQDNEDWSKTSVDRQLATSGGRHLIVEGEE